MHTRLRSAPLGPGRAVVLAEAGVEVDVDVDGSAFGDQAAHQERGGEQAAGDLGHHGVGEGEAAPSDRPGRLDGGAVVPVAAGQDLGGPSWCDPERARRRSADEPSEDGVGVEAGRAEPVDGPVAGDQRGGAGVAEQAVVLDRCRPSPPAAGRSLSHAVAHLSPP